jgi:diguanylate cyclase (GGDEF)-like protein
MLAKSRPRSQTPELRPRYHNRRNPTYSGQVLADSINRWYDLWHLRQRGPATLEVPCRVECPAVDIAALGGFAPRGPHHSLRRLVVMATDRQLSELLSEFACTMVATIPVQGILDHLVQRIVEILPITGAGVTLISAVTDPRYVAASDGSALLYEQLQSDLNEGPCLVASETGEALSVPDLRQNRRFEQFGPRALSAGLMAVFTFPLRRADNCLGALDLYSDHPGPLAGDDLAAAQTLADVTAAYLVNAQTRADLEEASARSHEDALRDALTGLPNRALLLERFEHALVRNRRTGKFVAVLYVDLDGLKAVNDAHGRRTGDRVLIAVVTRITALLRASDTLARMSGDEFVILCEDLDSELRAHEIAGRVIDALAERFMVDELDVEISASVGVAFAGIGGIEPHAEALLHEADGAMYQVKRNGGAVHQVVDLSAAKHRATMSHDLRRAVTYGQLRLEYQPIVHVGDGQVIGAEALVRWDHPTQGLVTPEVLIPLADRCGHSVGLGRWVLERACLDRRRWSENLDGEPFVMAVNVSARQLMAPNFGSMVTGVLTKTNTAASDIILEITESAFLRDAEPALLVLAELRERGVRLALDNFGKRFSSLTYLDLFPFHVVKLDQGLISKLGGSSLTQFITAKIIEFAHLVSVDVIVEGVETAEQRQGVVDLGVALCQGFYLARPMSADNLDHLMTSTNAGGIKVPALVRNSVSHLRPV